MSGPTFSSGVGSSPSSRRAAQAEDEDLEELEEVEDDPRDGFGNEEEEEEGEDMDEEEDEDEDEEPVEQLLAAFRQNQPAGGGSAASPAFQERPAPPTTAAYPPALGGASVSPPLGRDSAYSTPATMQSSLAESGAGSRVGVSVDPPSHRMAQFSREPAPAPKPQSPSPELQAGFTAEAFLRPRGDATGAAGFPQRQASSSPTPTPTPPVATLRSALPVASSVSTSLPASGVTLTPQPPNPIQPTLTSPAPVPVDLATVGVPMEELVAQYKLRVATLEAKLAESVAAELHLSRSYADSVRQLEEEKVAQLDDNLVIQRALDERIGSLQAELSQLTAAKQTAEQAWRAALGQPDLPEGRRLGKKGGFREA
eukprot:RCo050995